MCLFLLLVSFVYTDVDIDFVFRKTNLNIFLMPNGIKIFQNIRGMAVKNRRVQETTR